jgi:hypothetical protein
MEALGVLPETAAGFGRLISWELGPEGYRQAFIAAVVAGLRAHLAGAPALESRQVDQVAFTRQNTTWTRWANEWREWIESYV